MFTLKKEKNKEFRILVLTDIHFIDPKGSYEPGILTDEETRLWADFDERFFNDYRNFIIEANPDLLVLNGDNVSGEFDPDGNTFKRMVAFFESLNIPWTLINGNHDVECDIEYSGKMVHCGMGGDWQANYLKENAKHCLYEIGDPKDGYGNFSISIKEEDKNVWSLIMMDTHGCRNVFRPGIFDSQVDWYEKAINESGCPSFVFVHWPLYEYSLAQNLYVNHNSLEDFDNVDTRDGDFLNNFEKITYVRNDGFFEKIIELGSTKAVFAGHDHLNSSSIMYKGVRLVYATKSGKFGYYGFHGGTLVTVNDGDFKVKRLILENKYHKYADALVFKNR